MGIRCDTVRMSAKRETRKDRRSGFGPDAVLMVVMGALQLYRYPSFFFPRVKTFIDYFPPEWLKWLGNPVKTLVPNPIARMLVTIGTGIVIVYLAVDLTGWIEPRRHRWKKRLLTVFLIWTVAIPVLYESFRFIRTGHQLYAHDGGVIQTQTALRYLKAGRNPYTENYKGTLMDDGYDPNDPPLFHFPYLPFILELAYPFYHGSVRLFGMFDMRWLYLVCYAACVFVVYRLAGGGDRSLSAVILFGLNPLLTQFLVQGRNDVVTLALLLLGLYWLRSRSTPVVGMIFISLACAVKPFAWVLVPFLFVYCHQRLKQAGRLPVGAAALPAAVRFYLPLWLPWLLSVGPFILWDFHSLLDDVILFNTGRSTINYALGGTPGVGFPNLILYFGWVDSLQDYFPLWPFQLIFGGGILVWMLLRQKRYNTLRHIVTGYVLVLFVLLYFARLFHDNYLGYLGSLMIVSVFGDMLNEDGWVV